MNFKVFHKYGPLATRFYELRKSLAEVPAPARRPRPAQAVHQRLDGAVGHHPHPDRLRVRQQGIHEPRPARRGPRRLRGAESEEDGGADDDVLPERLQPADAAPDEFFDNDTITPDVYNGAQAMFMLFPPVRVERRGAPGAPSEPTTSSRPAPRAIRRDCRRSGPTSKSATASGGCWRSTRSPRASGACRRTPMTRSSSC